MHKEVRFILVYPTMEKCVACKNAGYPEPQFDYDGGGLWTIFHFGKEYAETTQKTTLNEGVNEGVNGGDAHIDAINQIENVSDTTKMELAKILRLFHDSEGFKVVLKF